MLLGEMVVRKYGNLIDVSPDGQSPTPPGVRGCLEPALTYTHRSFLRGQEAKRYSKKGYAIVTEKRRLYSYDSKDRLVCSAALYDKVLSTLKSSNYGVQYHVKDRPVEPANAYEQHWEIVRSTFNFKPKQEEFVRSLIDYNYSCAEAPPAFGKTTMLAVICTLFPYARIDICSRRKDVVGNIRQSLMKYLPNIGQVGGGKKRVERVTVYTADSLHLSDGTAHIFIGDEAHELMADSYVRELARYRWARMYGISATLTGRKDGTDARMEAVFGPVRFSIDYQTSTRLGIILPMAVDWTTVNLEENPIDDKTELTAKERWGVWRNHPRNQMIADKAHEFPDEQVLIIVKTLEHAVYLRQFLPEYTLVYSDADSSLGDIESYIAKNMLPADHPRMTKKRRVQLRNDFKAGDIKKVISTSVWDTGVDFEQLAVVIRADASDSEIKDCQVPGRACRRHDPSGKQRGLVVDFLDVFDKNLYRKSLSRMRNYESEGWEQFIDGSQATTLRKSPSAVAAPVNESS